jgi:hypothetical protein
LINLITSGSHPRCRLACIGSMLRVYGRIRPLGIGIRSRALVCPTTWLAGEKRSGDDQRTVLPRQHARKSTQASQELDQISSRLPRHRRRGHSPRVEACARGRRRPAEAGSDFKLSHYPASTACPAMSARVIEPPLLICRAPSLNRRAIAASRIRPTIPVDRFVGNAEFPRIIAI